MTWVHTHLKYKRKLRVDQAVVVKTESTHHKCVRLARAPQLAQLYGVCMENADPSRCMNTSEKQGMTRKRTVIGGVTLNFELKKSQCLCVHTSTNCKWDPRDS